MRGGGDIGRGGVRGGGDIGSGGDGGGVRGGGDIGGGGVRGGGDIGRGGGIGLSVESVGDSLNDGVLDPGTCGGVGLFACCPSSTWFSWAWPNSFGDAGPGRGGGSKFVR